MTTASQDPIRNKLSPEERDAFVAEQVAEANRWASLTDDQKAAELEAAFSPDDA